MANSDAIIPTGKFIARIDEKRCIGCTLCIRACPFDAIVGAARRMHTVVVQYCTGCKLCLPPCPVDCIELVANTYFANACVAASTRQRRKWKETFARFSRANRKQRARRLTRLEKEKQELFERKKNAVLNRQ